MKRILTIAAVFAVCGLLFAGGTALAEDERKEVMELIPLQYMSAATAAQLFGGQLIPASPHYGASGYAGTTGRTMRGQTGYGGGYGSHQAGAQMDARDRSYGGTGYGQRGIDARSTYRR